MTRRALYFAGFTLLASVFGSVTAILVSMSSELPPYMVGPWLTASLISACITVGSFACMGVALFAADDTALAQKQGEET